MPNVYRLVLSRQSPFVETDKLLPPALQFSFSRFAYLLPIQLRDERILWSRYHSMSVMSVGDYPAIVTSSHLVPPSDVLPTPST